MADKTLAAAAHSTIDDFVRDYVCEHLSYRYFAFPGFSDTEQGSSRRVEALIREGKTEMGKPLLNPK